MSLLSIIQVVIAVLLVASILLQQRGGGLSPVLGGAQTYHTRRGIEQKIFWASIVLAVLFLATAAANLFVG